MLVDRLRRPRPPPSQKSPLLQRPSPRLQLSGRTRVRQSLLLNREVLLLQRWIHPPPTRPLQAMLQRLRSRTLHQSQSGSVSRTNANSPTPTTHRQTHASLPLPHLLTLTFHSHLIQNNKTHNPPPSPPFPLIHNSHHSHPEKQLKSHTQSQTLTPSHTLTPTLHMTHYPPTPDPHPAPLTVPPAHPDPPPSPLPAG